MEQAPRGGRATRVARFLLKVIVVLVLAVLAFGFLSFLPIWADFAATALLAAAAVALPWRPFWRRERETARTLRHTSRSRPALAAALALGGPVFTIGADLWFAHRFPRYAEGHWLAGPGWDVLTAAPFYLLALLLLATALSRPAAALAACGLGGITALGLWGYGSSDSSTAAISLLAPFFYGLPLVLLVFLIDAAVRIAAKHVAGRQRD